MGHRFPNPRRFKINWSYSVAEAARCGDVHQNTIRNWIRMGLKPVEGLYPAIITGQEFSRFLTEKRKSRKSPCKSDELYCLRCRKPQRPAGDMADFEHIDQKRGCLMAICPVCNGMMNRRMNPASLQALKMILSIQERQQEKHINDRAAPSLNYNFGRKEK